MPENLQNNPWFQLAIAVVIAVAIVYVGWNVWPNTVQMQTANNGIRENITTLQKEVKDGLDLEQQRFSGRAAVELVGAGRERGDCVRDGSARCGPAGRLRRGTPDTAASTTYSEPDARMCRRTYTVWLSG